LQCYVAINFFKVALKRNRLLAQTSDKDGNLPLHRILGDRPFRLKEKEAICDLLQAFPGAALHCNHTGQFPLLIALYNKIPWENGVNELVRVGPRALELRDSLTGLYPFQIAAAVGGRYALETTYHLLRPQPDLLRRHL
jgi:hypothetical protein